MRLISSAIISFTIFILPSCKKGVQPIVKLEVAFKKDGVSETLIPYYSAIQPNATIPGVTNFTMVAKSPDDKVHFAITVQVHGDFTTGIYTTTNTNCYVTPDYFRNQGMPDERDFGIDNAPGQAPGYFFVNIFSITDKEIKGTFSGNYLYDRPHNEMITVSEGSFVVRNR